MEDLSPNNDLLGKVDLETMSEFDRKYNEKIKEKTGIDVDDLSNESSRKELDEIEKRVWDDEHLFKFSNSLEGVIRYCYDYNKYLPRNPIMCEFYRDQLKESLNSVLERI